MGHFELDVRTEMNKLFKKLRTYMIKIIVSKELVWTQLIRKISLLLTSNTIHHIFDTESSFIGASNKMIIWLFLSYETASQFTGSCVAENDLNSWIFDNDTSVQSMISFGSTYPFPVASMTRIVLRDRRKGIFNQ